MQDIAHGSFSMIKDDIAWFKLTFDFCSYHLLDKKKFKSLQLHHSVDIIIHESNYLHRILGVYATSMPPMLLREKNWGRSGAILPSAINFSKCSTTRQHGWPGITMFTRWIECWFVLIRTDCDFLDVMLMLTYTDGIINDYLLCQSATISVSSCRISRSPLTTKGTFEVLLTNLIPDNRSTLFFDAKKQKDAALKKRSKVTTAEAGSC